MQENPTFKKLLEGCRKQHRPSQNALYKAFYAYGMSICIRYVNNENEAISLLNDGFLKVFKNIKKFDAEKPFKPWLRRILINTAINHVKKHRKFKLEVSMDEARNVKSREDILSNISYQELLTMVQSLSTAYRTVFNMYVIDGFKHHEIAKELGIDINTSKSNLSRARAKLKELVIKKMNSPYV
ncbi:MAG: sigma-70 family RNA polymerase sigma factor [Bacteroidota bacterium]